MEKEIDGLNNWKFKADNITYKAKYVCGNGRWDYSVTNNFLEAGFTLSENGNYLELHIRFDNDEEWDIHITSGNMSIYLLTINKDVNGDKTKISMGTDIDDEELFLYNIDFHIQKRKKEIDKILKKTKSYEEFKNDIIEEEEKLIITQEPVFPEDEMEYYDSSTSKLLHHINNVLTFPTKIIEKALFIKRY